MRLPGYVRALRSRPEDKGDARESRKTGEPRGRRFGIRVPGGWRSVVAAITVLASGVAGAGWYADQLADDRDEAARRALRTATPAAKAIFSYDYRTFDASVANGSTFVTGDFAREYAETTAALKSTAVAEQAVVLAEVSAAGVVRAEPDEVELLLYLNQYRRNTNITGEKVDQNRVILRLVLVDGEWKVDRAVAI